MPMVLCSIYIIHCAPQIQHFFYLILLKLLNHEYWQSSIQFFCSMKSLAHMYIYVRTCIWKLLNIVINIYFTLTCYAGIALNDLLYLKLCWHSRRVPNGHPCKMALPGLTNWFAFLEWVYRPCKVMSRDQSILLLFFFLVILFSELLCSRFCSKLYIATS